jgi:2-phosphoglycerate kinase
MRIEIIRNEAGRFFVISYKGYTCQCEYVAYGIEHVLARATK